MLQYIQPLKARLRPFARPLQRALRQVPWGWYLRQVRPVPHTAGAPPRLAYLHTSFPQPLPDPQVVLQGGAVKYRYLDHCFPHNSSHSNIFYGVSSSYCVELANLIGIAQAQGLKFVWNQNGVGYPAWLGPGWETLNIPMARMLHAADYVFYQSEFCKNSADQFLGPRHGPAEILSNAIDTRRFTPAATPPDTTHLTLLLGGTQYQYYRLETALHTLALLVRQHPHVRLLVTGGLTWMRDEQQAARIAHDLVRCLGIADRVTFLGPYTQQDAPEIFRQAHILLHTKYNDPCPSVVIEAMSSGLPVVYSDSGGTPELVGNEAGLGVPAPLSWEQDYPPDPEHLAACVLQVADNLHQYAQAARERAVAHFDIQKWIYRHHQVFDMLLGTSFC